MLTVRAAMTKYLAIGETMNFMVVQAWTSWTATMGQMRFMAVKATTIYTVESAAPLINCLTNCMEDLAMIGFGET